VARGRSGEGSEPVPVSAIMKTEPVTIPPTTPTLEAMKLMREGKLGCLPVVSEGRLVGLVTEHDLIEVAAILLEKFLQGH
jgi:CBS domain-containing protein